MTARVVRRDRAGDGAAPRLYTYGCARLTMRRDALGLDAAADHAKEYAAIIAGVAEWAAEQIGEDATVSAVAVLASAALVQLVVIERAAMRLSELGYEGVGKGADGASDAMRHCMWQCMMARRFGSDLAKRLGDIHEKHGLANAKAQARLAEASAKGEKAPADKLREQMDQWNNACGRDCAASGKGCTQCCLEAIQSGHLLWTPDPGRPELIGPRPCPNAKARPGWHAGEYDNPSGG